MRQCVAPGVHNADFRFAVDNFPHEEQAALESMTVTQAVRAEDVMWVLTVPVCCTEPAKHFMRRAAIQAGFIKGGDDDEVRYTPLYRSF